MLEFLLAALAAVRVFLRSRQDTALEILALRQQLAVLKRKRPRPRLNPLDRLFWTALRRFWSRWAEVLVMVKPQTVVAWHRAGCAVLREDETYIAQSREHPADVSRDPRPMIFDRSEPCYIQGTKTMIAVSFQGDAIFFRIQPQTYTLNLPRGEITKDEILLIYVRTDQNGEAVKPKFPFWPSGQRRYTPS